MTCYRPLTAYKLLKRNENGKHIITFNRRDGVILETLTLPCRQCIGCRLERSRQWAIRCAHEAQLHEHNCFITLTYNDENLPENMSLDVREFQLFMKRLRKKFGSNIRFFHCGEYGEKFGRPHYHACLFNFDFEDKKLWKMQNGNRYYVSDSLNKIWGKGYCIIGDVTFQSAAYVARYITKKITGDDAEQHYEYVVPTTGEIIQKKPEYITMSRRPGIGYGWYQKFKKDVYPHDEVVINAKAVRPPKYYDGLYELEYPSDFKKIKHQRIVNAKIYIDNNSSDMRLYVREQVKIACVTQKLYRNLEREI